MNETLIHSNETLTRAIEDAVSLPDWLRPGVGAESHPNAERSGRRKGRWTRRGLDGILSVIAQASRADVTQGYLQRLDPRAKIVGLLGALVAATFIHSLPTLAAAYLVCGALAAASRLSWRSFAALWLTAPTLSAFIALPAATQAVTSGVAFLTLPGGAGHPWLTFTAAGLTLAARFVLRSAVCVTLAWLLAGTTPPHRLLRAFRSLGLPALFVSMLEMMTRYLVSLSRAAEEIHLAKLSRSLGAESVRGEQAWIASGIGALFTRSQALAQEVTLAMLSRGYTGEMRSLEEPRLNRRDTLFLTGATLLIALGLAWR